jgi:hypothetical protein
MGSRKIPVDISSVQTAHEGDQLLIDGYADPVFTDSDAVMVASAFQLPGILDLLQALRLLYMLDDRPDPT